MSDTVIRQVTQGIWTFSKPFARVGLVPFGGRTTAVKLQSGDVWVLASTPLTPETRNTIDALGPVKYIMAGDSEHSLFLAEFKNAYPNAKLIGVEPLIEAKKDTLTFDGAYGKDPEGTKYGFEPEITACYFSGFANKDVAWLHAPTKTLIQADLLFNLPPVEQYSKTTDRPSIPIISALLSPYNKGHKYFTWTAGKDKDSMKRDARTVAGWDFERIIPCHGDVIEKDAKAAWLEAYKWYLE